MSSIKRHNLDLHIALPADAPAGHPHIIDFSHIDENGPTDELYAVDAIATTLFRWSPEALQNLLNMKIENFHWGHINHQGLEHYVKRIGRAVHVGSLEIRKGFSDYEVQYSIDQDGSWQITGGREDAINGRISFQHEDRPERCTTYDHMFAMDLILNQMWMPVDMVGFRYEIEGKNMLITGEDQHIGEKNIENKVALNWHGSSDDGNEEHGDAENELGTRPPRPSTPNILTDSKKHNLSDTIELLDCSLVKRQRIDIPPSVSDESD